VAVGDEADLPMLSVIIPARNEGTYIERSLGAVLGQDWPGERLEVIVVDGGSTDDTVERVKRLAAEYPGTRVNIVLNPRRITPVSMNLGIAAATGDIVVRVDGHCVIEPGYLRRVSEVLRDTGHDNVGGVCITEGETPTARAIAAAQSSRFGVGNVAFRVGQAQPGATDTVPFGAWPRRVFDQFGTFDEELVRNQDDELNFRIVQGGGTVWFDPAIRSRYFARGTLRSLARQYHQYGLYKVRVMQKRGGVASPRHLVPAVFVAGLSGSILLALLTRRARWLVPVLVPYGAATGVTALRVATEEDVHPATVAAALVILHTTYGAGFLRGLWHWRRHW
jgi:glycosyltransferase involved in cell wall biosynthesis